VLDGTVRDCAASAIEHSHTTRLTTGAFVIALFALFASFGSPRDRAAPAPADVTSIAATIVSGRRKNRRRAGAIFGTDLVRLGVFRRRFQRKLIRFTERMNQCMEVLV